MSKLTPREELRNLINEQAIRTDGPFNLSSGGTSDVLVDLSRVLRTNAGFYALSRSVDIDYSMKIDAVGGPLSGSDPVAAALMVGYAFPRWFGVRKQSKDRGYDTDRITGSLNPGDRVLLVEDVCTTGGNLLRIAEDVKAFGATIERVFVVVDRGGLENVRNALGVPCTSLFRLEGKQVFGEWEYKG